MRRSTSRQPERGLLRDPKTASLQADDFYRAGCVCDSQTVAALVRPDRLGPLTIQILPTRGQLGESTQGTGGNLQRGS